MRSPRASRSLVLLLAAARLGSAGPYPRDNLHDAGYSFLMPRDSPCYQYCGATNQYCCYAGESCTTLAGGRATCLAAAGGYNAALTTTWTETRTYTSTIMTWFEPAPLPTPGVDCVPANKNQEPCGSICCAAYQTCAYKGQCSAKPGYGDGQTIIVTSNDVVTTQYSAPYRVTGTTTVTNSGLRTDTAVTGTAYSATATSSAINETMTTGGTGGDLSGGEIAGIVIGTLAGVSLLLLLCFCCIARGLWVAIFGKKKKDDGSRERVDVYEERYSRHGSRPPPSASAHSRRDQHKSWFGSSRPSSASDRREKKSSGKKWLGIAGLAATLLALLNLKKDKRPARSKPSRSSRYSDSYYSYSDYTSPTGSSSSGGRTTHTRRTRDSRAQSYYSRSSRRP